MYGRVKDRALVYLRRSTGHQEASLTLQLDWAIKKSKALGVSFDASPEDLNRMIVAGGHCHDDIYLDDGITGADLTRPGFIAFRKRAIEDKRISHLLIHMSDRFARPELAVQAASMEMELRAAGITVVFSDQTVAPRDRGQSDLADDISTLFRYAQSGDFLRKHATRIIETQITLAKGGYWAGGRPPYGFIRILVDQAGNEIQEMPDGTSVHRRGCHTRIKPKDLGKIAVWLMILDRYSQGHRGAAWIAGHLNELGIPSPDAGRTRTDNGVKHRVTGKWNPTTVLSLIRNPAIIGIMRYGVQSEGAHRRLGLGGPRTLLPSDLKPDGKPRMIRNPQDVVIESKAGFDPIVEPVLHHDCNELLDHRGRCQRGVTRVRDPAKYPLALRLFDLTDGCGHPMYGRTSGNRRLYGCGRYMKTAGAECEHNQVDAEAVLRFVLAVFQQSIQACGSRKVLEDKLHELSRGEDRRRPERARRTLTALRDRLAAAEEDLELIGKNLSRATNAKAYERIEREFETRCAEVERIRRECDRATANPAIDDSARRVASAMALFDDLERLVSNPEARGELPQAFAKLDFRMGLCFAEGRKGNRSVRLLKSGIITTGGHELPVPAYGKDAYPRNKNRTGGRRSSPANQSRREGVSFTKVNRGD